MTLTRRDAMRGGTATLAAIAAGGAVTAAASDRDADIAYIEAYARKREELRRGVQALVRMIREDLSGCGIMAQSFDVLQEAASYLETLPGIQPVTCEQWEEWKEVRKHWNPEWPPPRLPFAVESVAGGAS